MSTCVKRELQKREPDPWFLPEFDEDVTGGRLSEDLKKMAKMLLHADKVFKKVKKKRRRYSQPPSPGPFTIKEEEEEEAEKEEEDDMLEHFDEINKAFLQDFMKGKQPVLYLSEH